jgi:hypothetical protein
MQQVDAACDQRHLQLRCADYADHFNRHLGEVVPL